MHVVGVLEHARDRIGFKTARSELPARIAGNLVAGVAATELERVVVADRANLALSHGSPY